MVVALVMRRTRRKDRALAVFMSMLLLDLAPFGALFLSQHTVLEAHGVLYKQEVQLRCDRGCKPEDSKRDCQE
jgi:hypothetical protein